MNNTTKSMTMKLSILLMMSHRANILNNYKSKMSKIILKGQMKFWKKLIIMTILMIAKIRHSKKLTNLMKVSYKLLDLKGLMIRCHKSSTRMKSSKRIVAKGIGNLRKNLDSGRKMKSRISNLSYRKSGNKIWSIKKDFKSYSRSFLRLPNALNSFLRNWTIWSFFRLSSYYKYCLESKLKKMVVKLTSRIK